MNHISDKLQPRLNSASEFIPQGYNFAQLRDLNAVLLGPVVGLLLWVLPLGLEPVVQKAFALFLFMIIYWVIGPVDHAVTAMIGCYLFWALGIVEFSVAFGGFCQHNALVSFWRATDRRSGSAHGLSQVTRLQCITTNRHLLFATDPRGDNPIILNYLSDSIGNGASHRDCFDSDRHCRGSGFKENQQCCSRVVPGLEQHLRPVR
jgi:hypothetical protein